MGAFLNFLIFPKKLGEVFTYNFLIAMSDLECQYKSRNREKTMPQNFHQSPAYKGTNEPVSCKR